MLNRVLQIACVAVALGPAAQAQQFKPLKPFITLCTEKESTGFRWTSSGWAKTASSPRTYVVKKIDTSNLRSDDFGIKKTADGQFQINFCTEALKKGPLAVTPQEWANPGCYAVTEPGKAEKYGWCYESYLLRGGNWELFATSCETNQFHNMTLKPDGAFVAGDTTTMIDGGPPSDPYPEMRSSYGRCISISK